MQLPPTTAAISRLLHATFSAVLPGTDAARPASPVSPFQGDLQAMYEYEVVIGPLLIHWFFGHV